MNQSVSSSYQELGNCIPTRALNPERGRSIFAVLSVPKAIWLRLLFNTGQFLQYGYAIYVYWPVVRYRDANYISNPVVHSWHLCGSIIHGESQRQGRWISLVDVCRTFSFEWVWEVSLVLENPCDTKSNVMSLNSSRLHHWDFTDPCPDAGLILPRDSVNTIVLEVESSCWRNPWITYA